MRLFTFMESTQKDKLLLDQLPSNKSLLNKQNK